MMADMEVDKVADLVADMAADKKEMRVPNLAGRRKSPNLERRRRLPNLARRRKKGTQFERVGQGGWLIGPKLACLLLEA